MFQPPQKEAENKAKSLFSFDTNAAGIFKNVVNTAPKVNKQQEKVVDKNIFSQPMSKPGVIIENNKKLPQLPINNSDKKANQTKQLPKLFQFSSFQSLNKQSSLPNPFHSFSQPSDLNSPFKKSQQIKQSTNSQPTPSKSAFPLFINSTLTNPQPINSIPSDLNQPTQNTPPITVQPVYSRPIITEPINSQPITAQPLNPQPQISPQIPQQQPPNPQPPIAQLPKIKPLPHSLITTSYEQIKLSIREIRQKLSQILSYLKFPKVKAQKLDKLINFLVQRQQKTSKSQQQQPQQPAQNQIQQQQNENSPFISLIQFENCLSEAFKTINKSVSNSLYSAQQKN